MSFHREPKKRQLRPASYSADNARDAVGAITTGCEIYGLSNGTFSLSDLILYLLETTGPADLTISTWTAANADITHANKLLTSGVIRSLRFVVDFSFPSRQPAYCTALREAFGDAAIRVTKTHAKFVLIRNDHWNLAVRTSMNLNANKRLENFEISDDTELCDYLHSFVADLFAAQDAGQGFTNRPIDNMRQFDTLTASPAPSQEFFSDSFFGNDLRRSGLVFNKPTRK